MYRIVKRVLDVIFSFVLLVILSPLLLLMMFLIRLETPGKALFRQQRIGLHGKPFEIYKLRTMRTDAPRDTATSALQNADSYITRVGRFLRKTSLDELPQLFNILRGDMSLIGPRPLVPGEGPIHQERMLRGAYGVRPGITGWAQVNGRDQVNAGKKAELDGYYVRHLGLWIDIRILFYSVVCVVTARGIQEGSPAYDDEVDEAKRTPRKADRNRPAS